MSLRMIKLIYLIGAIYDMLSGIIFALFFEPIYNNFGLELPNHAGYVQLPAVYTFVFGVGFYLIYKNPLENRGLVILGILMKIGFIFIVFGHLIFDSIPHIYIPFAVIDVFFGILFVMSYSALKKLSLNVSPELSEKA